MIETTVTYDERDLTDLMRRMQALKSQLEGGDYPMAKILRNAARDFAQAAYLQTRSAAVRKTPFLQIPDKGNGVYASAFRAAQASNARNHGSRLHPEGRHVLTPGMYLRGAMRWVRKTRTRNLGRRGGTTPNPPYPVAAGYARASWIGVFRALGMGTRRPPAQVPESATGAGQATVDKRSVVVGDRLSYIAKLDRMDNIVAAGMGKASERLRRGCAEKARQLEDRWRMYA